MALYRIDVHRGSVTVTGRHSGKSRRRLYISAPPILGECDGSEQMQSAGASVSATTPWGATVSVEEYLSGTGTPGGGPIISGSPMDIGIKFRASAGFGATAMETIVKIRAKPGTATLPVSDSGTDVTISWEGTFTFGFALESIEELSGGSHPFADYNGPESIDSPPWEDLSIWERFVPGSLVSAHIEADVHFTLTSNVPQDDYDPDQSGGAGSTATAVGHVLMPGYGLNLHVSAFGREDDGGASIGADDWLGASRPTLVADARTGGAHAVATIAGAGASVAVQAGVCESGSGTANNTVSPARAYQLSGTVRRMEEGYSGAKLKAVNGTIDVTADGAGNFSYSASQRQYFGSVSSAAGSDKTGLTDSDSDSDSINEWAWTDIELNKPWLVSEGLEPTLWPVKMLAHPPYTSFTLGQAAERIVSSAFTGSGPGDITRALSAANGADASLLGTAWSNCSLHGYAYLAIRLSKTGDPQDITVKIGGKHWDKDRDGNAITVTSAVQEVVIDLLCPTNGTLESDGKDSRYPYASVAPIVVDDSELWGVSNAASIVLSGLDSEDYDVEWIKLIREGKSEATALQGFGQWVQDWNDTETETPTEYSVRLLDLTTDGCRDWEHIGFYRIGDGLGGWNYHHRSLSDLIGSINGAAGGQPSDGWSATAATFDTSGCTPTLPDLPQLSPCFLNNDRYAGWLYGGGLYWLPTSLPGGGWKAGFDLDCSGGQTMPAQMMFHRLLTWPPNLGDVLGLHDGSIHYDGGRTPLRAAVVLNAQGIGVTHGENDRRASGVQVTIADGNGSGSSGADGVFQTGTPFVEGASTHLMEAEGNDSPLTIAFFTRCRHRGAYRVVVVSVTATCIEVDSARGWLHVGAETLLRVYQVSTLAPVLESPEYPTVARFVRLREDRRRARLYALGVDTDDTTWRLFMSEDGGYSATEVFTVTARSALVEVDSERGVVTVFWENEAGVFRQQSDHGGDIGTFGSPEEVTHEDAQLDGILTDCDIDKRFSGRVFLLCSISDDTRLLMSEDMGSSFVTAL